jgi:hypothetical protein
MTSYAVWHSVPPPCNKACWEYLDDPRARFIGGWSYTESVHMCGHFLDRNSGVWKWRRDHPPTPNPHSTRLMETDE